MTWQECSGCDNTPHKVHRSLTLYDGLCQLCAINVARKLLSLGESIPLDLVQAMADAMDAALKNWQDEIRGAQEDARRWEDQAYNRGRDEGLNEAGYWSSE